MKKKFEYTGRDNLESMRSAHNYNSFLLSLLKPYISNSNTRILDFGSGVGTYADLLHGQLGIKPDCFEPDSDQKKILKDKGYKVLTDFSNNSLYDIIYAFNVMEHIESDIEVFLDLKKLLKPGGVVIIYVPAFNLLFSSMDELVGHHRRYRKNRLSEMAEVSKLRTVDLQYCDSLGFFVSLIYKIMPKSDGRISPSSVKIYDKYLFPVSRLLDKIFKNLFGKNVFLVAKHE